MANKEVNKVDALIDIKVEIEHVGSISRESKDSLLAGVSGLANAINAASGDEANAEVDRLLKKISAIIK